MKNMKKGRKLVALIMALTLGVMATAAGCGQKKTDSSGAKTEEGSSAQAEKGSSAPAETSKKDGLTIKVVPMASESPYWLALREGAEDAAKDFGDEWGGIEIQFDAPKNFTDAQAQIDIINNAVTAGCDGLVVAPCNPTSSHDAIVSAIQKGVNVICVDNPLEQPDADAFFGANAEEMTGKLAEYMVDHVLDGKGTYMEVLPSLDNIQQNQRHDGFVNTLKEKCPDMKDFGYQLAEDAGKVQDIVQNVLVSNKLACIFASTDRCGLGVLNALRQNNLSGKVKFCSVDCNLELLQGMRDGTVQALALQMPHDEGYYGVKMILDLKSGKQIEKNGDSGSFLVTPDNMDSDEAVAAIRQYISDYQPEDSK